MKRKAIELINRGQIQFEPRQFGKNLYADGIVSDNDIIQIIANSKGDHHRISQHHFLKDVEVHIIKAIDRYDGFYVKFYFIEPDIWFISVHL